MTSLPDRTHSRAVLIGTSDFKRADHFPPLPAVRNNLFDLMCALTAADTGILGWQQCVLVDTPDTVSSFMERLRKTAHQAEDLLVVYYAGHGVRHDVRDELYLTVRDSDRDGLAGTAVPFDFVREVLADSPARVKLLILDCCYSGTALGAMSAGGIGARDIAVAGTTVITSSAPNRVSLASEGHRNTAFTSELIDILTRGASLASAPLTINTLYRSLLAATANHGIPEPRFKSTGTSADLLLRGDRPPVPEPVAVPVAAATPAQVPPAPVANAPIPTAVVPPPAPVAWPENPRPLEYRPMSPLFAGAAVGPPSVPPVRPAPSARGAASGVSRVVSGLLLIPLWLGVIFGVAGTLAGVVGFLFGTPPPGKTTAGDLAGGAASLMIGVCCAVLLRWPVARWRAGRSPVPARLALRVVLLRPLSRIPPAVSVIVLAMTAPTTVAMAVGRWTTSPTSSGSALGSAVFGTGIMLLVSVLFALSIRCRRKRAQAAQRCPKWTLPGNP
ncbi:hypothetical protein GCM10022243_00090 [Saccharothrix violaceirubra]|uniref:Peptidase C14 caspase domain-containing protein n=1 Tax=Saccharothrix violaceirubra TaxID=413306 RepID=A0A7W7T2R0_9PSEU|nr:caspase family protein [Saccharothrix violaceirubra]MBB4965489.1 hypothetical protein [Saccharothrix violaceirubra]